MTKMLGFDRQIKKVWLDITMELLAEGKSVKEIKEKQESFMAADLSGKIARRKTRLVISRMWLDDDPNLVVLRREALSIFEENPEIDTRIFHWGLCLAAYPFFRDIAAICGRLIALQGYFGVSQVHDRISKIWGERSTLTRASSRVIQTIRIWKLIESADKARAYTSSEKTKVAVQEKHEAAWLIHSLLMSRENGSISVDEIGKMPELFPFKINFGLDSLVGSKGIEISRQGLKASLISLKKPRQ